MSNTAGQDTVAAFTIPYLILWAGRFFVVRYSAGEGDGSIKASVAVPTSGSMLTLSRPLCLILSSCVSIAIVPSSPHFYYVILIFHCVHHHASLLLSPLSCLYDLYLLLSQSPANHCASRDVSIVAPRRLQQIPPPPNLAIAATPLTLVSNVVLICLINSVSAVILMILPTASPEQQNSLSQKRLVRIEAKSPCWNSPLSLCSVLSYFPRRRPSRSCIGYLFLVRTQPHRCYKK